MRIYLDDERETPNGYIRTYTVEETIALISQNSGTIEVVSLDNDLGIALQEGRKVMDWIEESAFNNTLLPIPYLYIHSQNSSARDAMMQARHNAWKYWEGHGYVRSEWVTKLRRK